MIFISYSHKDVKWKELLETQLRAILVPKGISNAVIWSDSSIAIGNDWMHDINNALNQTKAAVFLVSANFQGSEFIINKEYAYFVDNPNVRVFWILISSVNYQALSYLDATQAARYKNLDLVPLDKLFEPDQNELLKNVSWEIYQHVFPDTQSESKYSSNLNEQDEFDENINRLNRKTELLYFNFSSAFYTSDPNPQNLLLYSLEGFSPLDDLDKIPSAIYHNILKTRYVDWTIHYDYKIDTASMINSGIDHPYTLIFGFKDALQKMFRLSPEKILNITVNDIFQQMTSEKILYLVTLYIPSTSFKNATYKGFFDWIKDTFIKKTESYSKRHVILLFVFEKIGDLNDAALESFVRKLANRVSLPKIFGKQEIILPKKDYDILHLGEHHEVTRDQITEWIRKFAPNMSNDQSLSQMKERMRMSEATKFLQSLILKK